MSYNERLSAFNNAVAMTDEHIKKIRDKLTSPELVENPVKQGLETAGQISATAGGILGLKKSLEEKGMLRRGVKAIYNRLGNLGQSSGSTSTPTTDAEARAQANRSARNAERNERGTREGQSDGSGNADGTRTDTGTGDRPTGQGSERQAPADEGEGEGGGFIEDDAPGTIGGTGEPPQDPEFGDISRFRTGTIEGEPEPPTIDQSALGSEGLEFDEDPTGGSYGASASRTTAGAGEGVSDARLPNSLAGQGAEDGSLIRGTGEDASEASRALQGGADEGASVLDRAQQLTGQVRDAVSGSATSSTPAGQANSVSRAQQGNADAHQQANDSSGQASRQTTDPNAEEQANRTGAGADGAEGGGGSGGAGASDGAINEAENSTRTGLQTALEGEETADEVLGEVPVLGPILEAGSLLATLGTSIASLFEPAEKKETPQVPKGKMPQDVSVGANLKNTSAGAVGAY